MISILASVENAIRTDKKLIMVLILTAALFFLSGCTQLDVDMKIEADLSGQCVAKVLSIVPMSAEEIKQQLVQAGVKDYTIDPIQETIQDNGQQIQVTGWKIKTSWKTVEDLQKLLKTVSGTTVEKPFLKNEDGTVSVNLGRIGATTTRIHVAGRIIPESTAGKVTGNNFIEFSGNPVVSFKFKPSSGIPIQMISWGVGLLVVIGVISFYIKRRAAMNVNPFLLVGIIGLIVLGVFTFNHMKQKAEPIYQPTAAITTPQSPKPNNGKEQPTASQSPGTNANYEPISKADMAIDGITLAAKKSAIIDKFGKPSSVRNFICGIGGSKNTNFEEHIYSGIAFTFDSKNGGLWDISVTGSNYSTKRGIKVGDSLSKVESLYGPPQSTQITQNNQKCYMYQHTYSPNLLTFVANPSTSTIERISVDNWSL